MEEGEEKEEEGEEGSEEEEEEDGRWRKGRMWKRRKKKSGFKSSRFSYGLKRYGFQLFNLVTWVNSSPSPSCLPFTNAPSMLT